MSIREIAERLGIDITGIQGEPIDVLTGKRMHDDSFDEDFIGASDADRSCYRILRSLRLLHEQKAKKLSESMGTVLDTPDNDGYS